MKLEGVCPVEIVLSGEGTAPSEFRIVGPGVTRTRKGDLVFDDKAAGFVASEHAKDPRRLPIDFDHSTEDRTVAPADRIAAGSFVPEIRNAELWAASVEWTPRGKAAVEHKEFRYTSLAGLVEREGNRMRLRRLKSVAITNTPATIGAEPLVASEGSPSEEAMAAETKQENLVTLALGAKDDQEAVTLAGDLKAVFSEAEMVTGKKGPNEIRGALQALKLKADRADELEAKLSEFAAQKEKDQREALIQKLSEEKKLPKTMHEWARKVPFESLVAFGECAQPYSGPADVESPSAEQVTDPELAKALAKVGLTEDDYRAAQKAGAV